MIGTERNCRSNRQRSNSKTAEPHRQNVRRIKCNEKKAISAKVLSADR